VLFSSQSVHPLIVIAIDRKLDGLIIVGRGHCLLEVDILSSNCWIASGNAPSKVDWLLELAFVNVKTIEVAKYFKHNLEPVDLAQY